MRKEQQTQVFMLNDDNRRGTRKEMDHFYTLDKSEADALVEEGKAIYYEGEPELDRYNSEIKNEVALFKKAYNKMKDSKDPRYQDAAFFAYETNKLKKELDEKVGQLQSEYTEIIQDIRNEAQQARANLTRNITLDDEKGAKQLMNELVSVAKLDGVDEAIERIEADTKYYREGRKAAIANELYRLVDIVSEEDRSTKRRLRALSNKLRQDSEGVELAARMAAALPDTTGWAYNQMKMIHPAYKRS